MEPVKILIVDDQRIMQDGLKTILQLDGDIEVVGLANDGEEAVALTGELRPDIVLMDIRMPRLDGVQATKIIKSKYPTVIILMLTTFDDVTYIMDALSYGASGYLLKDIDGEQLIQAIHQAKNGNIIMPGRVAAKIVEKIKPHQSETEAFSQMSQFNEREQEIIRGILNGKNNKEIAKELFLTEGTVKNYVSLIYSKINVTNRANAIVYFNQQREKR